MVTPHALFLLKSNKRFRRTRLRKGSSPDGLENSLRKEKQTSPIWPPLATVHAMTLHCSVFIMALVECICLKEYLGCGEVGWRNCCLCRGHKRHGFEPWVEKIPWSRKSQPAPVLAWKIPLTEEPDGLQSMGLQESDRTDRARARTHTHTHSLTRSLRV